MAKSNKVILSIICIIAGWFINAFAWTTKLGPSVSTISLLVGVGLFIGGIIFLIVILANRSRWTARTHNNVYLQFKFD